MPEPEPVPGATSRSLSRCHHVAALRLRSGQALATTTIAKHTKRTKLGDVERSSEQEPDQYAYAHAPCDSGTDNRFRRI